MIVHVLTLRLPCLVTTSAYANFSHLMHLNALMAPLTITSHFHSFKTNTSLYLSHFFHLNTTPTDVAPPIYAPNSSFEITLTLSSSASIEIGTFLLKCNPSISLKAMVFVRPSLFPQFSLFWTIGYRLDLKTKLFMLGILPIIGLHNLGFQPQVEEH